MNNLNGTEREMLLLLCFTTCKKNVAVDCSAAWCHNCTVCHYLLLIQINRCTKQNNGQKVSQHWRSIESLFTKFYLLQNKLLLKHLTLQFLNKKIPILRSSKQSTSPKNQARRTNTYTGKISLASEKKKYCQQGLFSTVVWQQDFMPLRLQGHDRAAISNLFFCLFTTITLPDKCLVYCGSPQKKVIVRKNKRNPMKGEVIFHTSFCWFVFIMVVILHLNELP